LNAFQNFNTYPPGFEMSADLERLLPGGLAGGLQRFNSHREGNKRARCALRIKVGDLRNLSIDVQLSLEAGNQVHCTIRIPIDPQKRSK
jgi:hypothetical protein